MKATHKTIAVLAATATALALGAGAASAAGRGFGNGNGNGNGFGMMGGGMMGGYRTNATAPGTGLGYGMMGRTGANAQGSCLGTTAASGTLTDAEKKALAAMAGEEKLAHDVYVTLAAKYPTATQFARISNSETMHLTAIRNLLTKYNLADPTAGLAVGVFASADRQAQYDSLIAKATDATSALAVGVTIEKLDIADLADLLKTVTAPDVKQVLTMLDRASDMHLAAFGG